MAHTLIERAARLTDPDLVAELGRMRGLEKENTAHVIAHLAEVERRELHLALGHASLFSYCQRVLGYSEAQSYGRIEVARCVRRFPLALDLVAAGSITMTSVGLLRPHLTEANHRHVLEEACGKTKIQVEEIVARLRPQPDAPVLLRRVATSTAVAAPRPAAPAARVTPPAAPVTAAPAPLSPDRYRYQLTIDAETRRLLETAKSLSTADDAGLLKRALELLVEELEKKKYAVTDKPAVNPRPPAEHSRHMTAAARRDADRKDGRQCGFVGSTGVRCTETRHLEFHHEDAWAALGETRPGKVSLRCRAHNQYEGRLYFRRDADGIPRLAKPVRAT